MIQSMVDDTYGQFLEAVSAGRNIPVEKLRALAQGQVFTGSQALANGLADGIGNLNTAVLAAKDLAKLKGEVEVIEAPGPFEKFFNIVYDVPKGVIDLLRFL